MPNQKELNMTNTPSIGTRAPQRPTPPRSWRWTLTLGLAIGVGLGFAHGAALGRWPGLNGALLSAVRVVAAIGIASLVARFLGWLIGIRRERQ
jgi:hypothetical protein